MLQPYTILYSSQIYTQHQKSHEVIMPVCLSQTFNAYSVQRNLAWVHVIIIIIIIIISQLVPLEDVSKSNTTVFMQAGAQTFCISGLQVWGGISVCSSELSCL